MFSNAQVTSGRDATFVAGQDISLIGANVSGRNVSLDAGRDLVLISQQNVSTSNAWSFNVSVTFQGATPTGGSLGGSFSNGARRYLYGYAHNRHRQRAAGRLCRPQHCAGWRWHVVENRQAAA